MSDCRVEEPASPSPAWRLPSKGDCSPASIPVVDVEEWLVGAHREFCSFDLQPISAEPFHARAAFKRGLGMSLAEVSADPHVATMGRSDREAADDGMVKMMWMLAGVADIEQGDRSCRVQRGEWVTHDLDRPYRFQSATPVSFVAMACNRALLGPLGAVGELQPRQTEQVASLALQFVLAALAQGSQGTQLCQRGIL